MKRVIRNNIFETNSSSTHSFTLQENKIRKEDSHIIIDNPFKKTLWILGLIDNAEFEYNNLRKIFEKSLNENNKDNVIATILENDHNLINQIENKYGSIKEASVSTLIDIVGEYFDYEYFSEYNNIYYNNSNFVDESLCRESVLKYREKIIEAYCEISKINKEEALDKIYYEAYKPKRLYYYLTCSDNPQEEIKKYSSYNWLFEQAYEQSEEKDLIKFSWKYIQDEIEIEKKKRNGKIPCCLFFMEDSLGECDCGFENFFNIEYKLDLYKVKNERDMKKHALKFLNGKSIIIAKET